MKEASHAHQALCAERVRDLMGLDTQLVGVLLGTGSNRPARGCGAASGEPGARSGAVRQGRGDAMTDSRAGGRPPVTLFTPAVRELVALGAALACNCEPCLRYHFREAKTLGIGDEDIRAALEMAAMVKQTPARNAQQLADKLLESTAKNQK